jgi:hypothetical protein
LLKGERRQRGVPIAFQAPLKRTDNPFAVPGSLQLALVGDRYKLTSFDGGRRYQLFDLLNDRAETRDIADQHPDTVQHMVRRLAHWTNTCAASAQGGDYPLSDGKE